MSNYEKKIYYVTQEQYDILLENGTITVGGVNYAGIDPNASYFVRSTPDLYKLVWDGAEDQIQLLKNGVITGDPLTVGYAAHANNANKLSGATLETALTTSDLKIPTSKAVATYISELDFLTSGSSLDASKLLGTVAIANGGTGQTTYTNGQLLIGNTTGNTLTKATLTQGTGITITNGAGTITIKNAAPHIATNIAEGTRTATSVSITSSTGTGATLSAATTSLAGVMSSTDKTKLDAATNTNTASAIVQRDASGNFSAGTITANLTGTASGNLTSSSSLEALNLSGTIPEDSLVGASIPVVGVVQTLTTNISGKNLTPYVADELHMDEDYPYTLIKYGASAITEARAKTYMKSILGTTWLPQYDYDWPKNIYIIDGSGILWKPQWTNVFGTYELRMYYVTKITTDLTLSSGTNNGTLKLVRNGVTTDNIAVKGLGSLAYSSATIPTNTNQLTNGAGFITSSSSITGSAGSVSNSLILKFDTGTTEGTNIYTFNGSGAKTIDFKSGTNVTITETAGVATFSSPSLGLGTTTGTGNAVTDISVSGHTVTMTKGSTFLTGNQTITLSGDVTGGGATAITTALKNSGVTAGSYTAPTISVDAQGRITSASSNTIPTVYNSTLTITAGNGLTTGGTFTTNQSSASAVTVALGTPGNITTTSTNSVSSTSHTHALVLPQSIETTATPTFARQILSQAMTNGNTSAFTAPHLSLVSAGTADNTGFVGMTFATSSSTNYGWSYGAQRTTNGNGDLIWRNHDGTAAGTERMRLSDAGVLTASTFVGALTGNANTATKLATARTLTIGAAEKTFNGSADVTWSLADIGLVTAFGSTPTDTSFPSTKLVYDTVIELDNKSVDSLSVSGNTLTLKTKDATAYPVALPNSVSTYAPTDAGTAGQLLISTGINSPTWAPELTLTNNGEFQIIGRGGTMVFDGTFFNVESDYYEFYLATHYLETINFGTRTETINIGGVSASPVVNTRVNFLGTTEATSSDASASFAGGVKISKKLRVMGDITTNGNIIAANTTTQTDTIDFLNFTTHWSYSAPTNRIRKYGNVIVIDFYATVIRAVTDIPTYPAPSISIPTGFRPSYTMSRVSSSIDGVLTDITINASTGEIGFPITTLGLGQSRTFRLYLTYII